MANVIVAITCNLIFLLIVASGVFSSLNSGVKVTLTKLILTLGGGVGSYFLTDTLSDKLYGVKGMTEVLGRFGNGISTGTINSCIFLILFLAFYAIALVTCNFVRYFLIKRLRNKRENKLRMIRAKSINPRAERMAKRAEWKSLKLKYSGKRKWYHKVISGVVGGIIAIVVGFVVLMPYGYIAKDINYKDDKDYLEKGYEYTLNGVIPDSVSDFLAHVEETNSEK